MFNQVKYFLVLFLFTLIVSCSNYKSNKVEEVKTNNFLSVGLSGQAIAYSGYRNEQHPDEKIYPSQDQVLEDLKILEKKWNLIRTYGADKHTFDVLEVIRREKLNLKVMLGIWLYKEPERIVDNSAQIQYGIELINKYSDIVVAANVGNESQIHWSDHKVPNEKLISYIKKVQSKVDVPVTTADTWDYWLDLNQSKDLIQVVDFIAIHVYPIWGKLDIDRGLTNTIEVYEKIKAAIPDKPIIISEAGWATYTVGELHVPKAGDEVKQKRYFNELMNWSKEKKVIVFWFEAFDEPWKGTGTEGYWGLFTEGRKAKLAMQKLYPELAPNGPTSPTYN